MSRFVLDLFAGPGGWDEGMLSVGVSDVVGIEWDAAACATRAKAGHRTIRADVSQYPVEPFVGKVRGLIASPPCQAFSMAGKGSGRRELAHLHSAVEACRDGWVVPTYAWDDPRTPLILEILRWAWALKPGWVACEQVPPALGLFEHMADILRSWGYSSDARVLCAADYCVPQTRNRAFLIASSGRLSWPEPTHAEKPETSLFGNVRLPWVTMAQALGWGKSGEPSNTIRGGRTDVWGGTGARLTMQREREAGRWVHERPATTLVGSFSPDIVAAPGYRTEISRQDAEGSVRVTVEEAAILQGFRPDYPWQGTKSKQFEQVGNVVCPPVAAAIVRELDGARSQGEAA